MNCLNIYRERMSERIRRAGIRETDNTGWIWNRGKSNTLQYVTFLSFEKK